MNGEHRAGGRGRTLCCPSIACPGTRYPCVRRAQADELSKQPHAMYTTCCRVAPRGRARSRPVKWNWAKASSLNSFACP
eukprot:9581268-Alexandrium_andersonii.AAC.1